MESSLLPWGTSLLRVLRTIGACTLAFALAEFAALHILGRQDSCLAYVELMPIMTISVGFTIAGVTGVLAAFAALLEARAGARLQRVSRIVFFFVIPVAMGLWYLFTAYAPIVETYLTNPEIFCD